MLKIWAKTLVKIRQNLLDHAKQSAKDALETATKRAIKKTDDLMINKVANDIPKKSPQNTSETVESETEMLKKKIHICRRKTANY